MLTTKRPCLQDCTRNPFCRTCQFSHPIGFDEEVPAIALPPKVTSLPRVRCALPPPPPRKFCLLFAESSPSTLEEYLWFLRMVSQGMDSMGRHGMLFLAAAVSDFHVPRDKLREHKIDSSRDAEHSGPAGLTLHLDEVGEAMEGLGHNVTFALLLARLLLLIFVRSGKWFRVALISTACTFFRLDRQPLCGVQTQAGLKYDAANACVKRCRRDR